MVNAMFSGSLEVNPGRVGAYVGITGRWQVELELCQKLFQHAGAGRCGKTVLQNGEAIRATWGRIGISKNKKCITVMVCSDEFTDCFPPLFTFLLRIS